MDEEDETQQQARFVSLALVAVDGRALRDVPDRLRCDPEVVAVAVAQAGVALQFASEALLDDHAVVLAAVQQTWVALEYASARLRGNRELVLLALAQSGLALKDASEELRADEEIVIRAIEQDGLALAYASEELRTNVSIVSQACEQNPQALQFASEDLRGMLSLVCPIVRIDGSTLRFASDAIRCDRDIVIDAMATCGMGLCWAAEKLKDDLEVVTKAVEECGCALAFASPRLQGDDRVVRAASRQDAQALEYASWELRNDFELIMDIMDRDARGLRWAGDLRDNDEIVTMAVRGCGMVLADASPRLREDKKVVLAAVQQDGRALLFAHQSLRTDRDVVLAAVSQHGGALAHASEEHLCDFELCRAGLMQDGNALAFVPEELRRERELVIAAVTQRGTALQYAPYDLRAEPEVAIAAVNEGGEDVVDLLSLDLKRDPSFVQFALAKNPSIPGMLEGRPRPLVRKFVLAKARRFLEPVIKEEHSIEWLEALPALRMISPLSELESAFTDPEAFIAGMVERPTEIAQVWALVCVRPALKPKVAKCGIVCWEDLLAALKHASATELRKAVDEPDKFLEELVAKRAGLASKWFVIAKLRVGLEKYLPKGLPWTDVAHVLDAVETVKELSDFLEGGPDLLYWKLQKGGEWPATKAFSKALLRLCVYPHVPGDPKPYWEDFSLVLKELHDDATEGDHEEEDTLKWAITDVKRFLQRLRMDPHLRAAKLWAFAQIRPRVEVALERQGNTWSEIVPLLEEMDTMRELQAALDVGQRGIESLLDRLAVGPSEHQDPCFPTSPTGPKVWEKW